MQLHTHTQDLVLVGGGHSHLAVLKNLAMKPIPGLRVTLLSRDIHTPYSGMIPGLIAGHYEHNDCHIDLRPLCQYAGVRLFNSSVTALDLDRHLLHCDNRPPVRFDWLSLNTGSTPALANIAGAAENGIAVKPIDQFLSCIERLCERLADNPGPHSIAVVGGGAASVEIILALQYRLQKSPDKQGQNIQFKLVSASERLLPSHNPRVSAHFIKLLGNRAIAVHQGSAVTAADTDSLRLANGEIIPANTIIWALPADSPAWPASAGLDCDEHGFIKVNSFLQSSSHPHVFAAGDAAHFETRPLAKSGVYAVRAGKTLADNLRSMVTEQPLRAFKPQKHFLSLLMEGNRRATASRGWFNASGRWLWRWKQSIDKRFVRNYSQFPAMATATGNETAMRCGGCGAKVGSSTLQRVMSELQVVPNSDILVGLNAPDDAAVIQPPAGKALVQTVDYFRSFIDDPYLLGKIATNHCLGDIYAMGATPHSALAIVTLPHQSEALLEDSLRQLMLGAMASLQSQNTSLIGGHSSEGAELGFGLSVNGFIDAGRLLRKSLASSGQAIILSKALGTGTLLAANMQHQAQGQWVNYAIAQMLIDNSQAARLLFQHGASACTDVTGFGLLGHLTEILRASGMGAQLQLSTLPLLPGAAVCLANGYLSTLHPQNMIAATALINREAFIQQPLFNILFDPQTAGGLLATVPAAQATQCLQALHDHGMADACIIGSIEEGIVAGSVLLK